MFRHLFYFLFLLSISVQGQHETDQFYFASRMALSFQSGNEGWERFKDCKLMHANGKPATMSDKYGNLLFYTDGYKVYNRHNQLMPNGDQLRYIWSSQEAITCIIVPVPGTDYLFYIFYTDDYTDIQRGRNTSTMGLRYAMVDMRLDGGNGAVTEKNKYVSFGGIPMFDKIAAVQHANGVDYWLLAHTYRDDRFWALQIKSYVILPPVISRTGKVYTDWSGDLRIAPDGSTIAGLFVNVKEIDGERKGIYSLDVYRFNNETGTVTDPISLDDLFYDVTTIEFSPDASKLYVSAQDTSQYRQRFELYNLFQFDLSAYNEQAIRQSYCDIARNCTSFNARHFSTLQLLPNGTLLSKRFSSLPPNFHHVLSVIHAPNELGAACFEELKIDTVKYYQNRFGITEGYGPFPNFVSSYFKPLFRLSSTCIRNPIQFLDLDTTAVESVSWDFSDPGSGAENHATGFAPYHTFSKGGNFIVHVSKQFRNGETITYHYNAHIKEPIAPFSLGKDTSLCEGEVFSMKPCLQGVSYLWHNGTNAPVYETLKQDTICLQISNSCGSMSDTIIVNRQPKPVHTALKDTAICLNVFSPFLLEAPVSNVLYEWSTGSAASAIQIDTQGLYRVKMSAGVCTLKDSAIITIQQTPVLDLGKDTAICEGERYCINMNLPGATYTWNNNTQESVYCSGLTDTISLQMTQQVCIVSDTLILTVKPNPTVALPSDTTLCYEATLLLNPLCAGCDYVWQDHATTASYLVSSEGTYHVQAVKNGCTDADTVHVKYIHTPDVYLGNDTILCNEASIHVRLYDENAVYTWQDQRNDADRILSSEGIYYVRSENQCGSSSDTIRITHLYTPVSLKMDSTLCYGDTLCLQLTPGYSYLWNDGSKDTQRLISSPVQHYITTSNVCGEAEGSISVHFEDCCEPFVPNLITANDDGKNDDLFISCTEEGGWMLELYNQSGTLILKTTLSGTVKMKDVAKGVYYYHVYKHKKSHKGWLQVM